MSDDFYFDVLWSLTVHNVLCEYTTTIFNLGDDCSELIRAVGLITVTRVLSVHESPAPFFVSSLCDYLIRLLLYEDTQPPCELNIFCALTTQSRAKGLVPVKCI